MATKKEQALQVLEIKYKTSRINLLVLILATILNVVLLLTKTANFSIFTITSSYLLVYVGAQYTGLFPAEYYEGLAKEGVVLLFEDTWFMVTLSILAALIVVLFAVCWFLSKKKTLALWGAVILLAIDTVILFIFSFDLINVLLRIWIGYNIISGLRAKKQAEAIEALPDEDFEPTPTPTQSPYGYDEDEDEEYATNLIYSDNYFDEDEAEEKSDTAPEENDEE